ncbi:MAG: nuclear transport factor 2 family protein [Terriglobales bacterium]|jgi:ketosteroid isomerase-like protein
MSTSMKENLPVVQKYFASLNETRLDDLGTVFAEEATLRFPTYEPIRGRAAIQSFYTAVLKHYPKHFDNPVKFFFSDDGSVAVEIHFEGETVKGQTIVFDAVDVFEVENGRVKNLRIRYDSAKVAKMLDEFEPR